MPSLKVEQTQIARRYSFMGCPVDAYFFEEAVAAVRKRVHRRDGRPCLVHFLNVAKIVKAHSSKDLREVLWDGDMVLADGQPLLRLGRWLGIRLPERVAGCDLMKRLLEMCDTEGFRVYLLGARQDILETCVQHLEQEYPGLQIAGYRNGYFKSEEVDSVIGDVNESRPDILFVGMGTPQKEIFAYEMRDRLKVPVVQGVGGTFDVIAGLVERAPRWMQRLSLEWFYRVLQEPQRLFWRYASTNTKFLCLYARYLLFSRNSGTPKP